jgi:4-amino-4-deoxy-L-arabinose transferase-like glycosyltransferase
MRTTLRQSVRRSESRIAAIIFLFAVVVLLALHGTRVVLTNDEGILLEPAQRVANGARPYVDFFAYMSPGSYWLQAAVFRLFGVFLWAGRVIVIVDFSLQCSLVFWLAARLASKRVAAMIALMFAGFQVADPTFLTAQHRWDSSTLALAGVSLAVDCMLGNSSKLRWILSGGVAGRGGLVHSGRRYGRRRGDVLAVDGSRAPPPPGAAIGRPLRHQRDRRPDGFSPPVLSADS